MTWREETVLRVMLRQCYSVVTLRIVMKMRTDFFIETEESEDSSSDSDSDLGDKRPTLTTARRFSVSVT
ncbi:hypothetical protein E2C01_041642 [Portunus trituberculatus]|uniref:Uncharacterized protein n=1 Tax=Portunus trituberculatus TaxID=210409 RepID=A0A5B7FKH0_PORTR|nr:hypothetical protein [Portunus trituberculatus]